MKKYLLISLGTIILFSSLNLNGQNTIHVFDQVLFYDGYAANVGEPVPEGIIRHKNSLYAIKLSNDQLSLFGSSITMNVTIKAACDNYDRIGNVNLAFVPKGNETYQPDSVGRIELGRFITPFMNKNKKPDTVPYSFEIDYLSHIFKEKSLLDNYDYWIELDVFGVPYAAQEQVRGCSNRNDVFFGSLDFVTSTPSIQLENNNILIPLFFKQNFNNHQENATDEIGSTVKTVTFLLSDSLRGARLVLITSNHGANAGGEEYNRRWHYVYFDGENVLTYKPGRESCEPFRVYNTQANGIYGNSTLTDEEWQSFSNWCPGDVIDNRIIELGELSPGEHTFKIEVPNAVFIGQQGNIPLSLFFMGKVNYNISVDKRPDDVGFIQIYPNPVKSFFYIKSNLKVKHVFVTNLSGQKILESNSTEINLEKFPQGIYFVSIEFVNGHRYTHKLVKQ